ncbi:c-type cytochrome [Ideonella livida]|uniref:C-type cytochrome n=1 Tax=Ideonella livida TaxID=2707176 RepID=A0A7C9PI86_9BURK|nr:c-type cytochrome [Ideonella livida]NDY92675.1 c-type cytochrome [Ideonella livida]
MRPSREVHRRRASAVCRWGGLLAALWAAAIPGAAWADAALPPGGAASAPAWAAPNPYRGQTAVLAAGREAYHQHCARCHGVQAEATAEAPDLRRLNGFCRRLDDADLRQRCLGDVDRHFLHSVLEGKVRAGVVYMPPWRGQLDAATVWSIRTWLEGQRPPPPRTTTTVERATAGP